MSGALLQRLFLFIATGPQDAVLGTGCFFFFKKKRTDKSSLATFFFVRERSRHRKVCTDGSCFLCNPNYKTKVDTDRNRSGAIM